MDSAPQLRTERLLLRRWRDDDLAALAAINADPRVMEHFPATLSVAETQAFLARVEQGFAQHGYGLWALEVTQTETLIGFTGLAPVELDVAFVHAVEVGWRLAHDSWGSGYATEAATAAIDFGFDELGLAEIVSFTAVGNVRSRRLMERLGMRREPAEDFDHPKLPVGHDLRAHVLYRLDRRRWRKSR